MKHFKYQLLPEPYTAQLGMVVLQSDVTIEDEFRHYFEGQNISLLVSRIPFENQVTEATLKQMQTQLAASIDLFPLSSTFDAIGYACTSGAMHIGSEKIQQIVQHQRTCSEVTNPMQSTLAALRALDVTSIGFLAPYSHAISQTMVDTIETHGIKVAVAATYNEPEDINVGRISPQSIKDSALALHRQAIEESNPIDALFIACTNMKCATIIPEIEQLTAIPVVSSNLALAWNMCRLAALPHTISHKGKLWQTH